MFSAITMSISAIINGSLQSIEFTEFTFVSKVKACKSAFPEWVGYLAQFNSISKCTGATTVIMHTDFKNNAYNHELNVTKRK